MCSRRSKAKKEMSRVVRLDAGGDAQLIEDSEKVLLHGVFAETEFLSNFAVGKALGDERNDLFLARCDQGVSVRVDHAQRWYLGDEVNEIIDLLRGRPDLSEVHHLNAFAKSAKGRNRKTKQAASARTKGVD